MLTRDLMEAGASEGAIARHVRAGSLVRPRRGWIALPHADPILLRAAQLGVVIACVSAAAHLGLWDTAPGRIHLGVAPNARLPDTVRAHVHWGRPVVPRKPGELVDRVENVLAAVARCEPYENALAIWEAALRQGKVAMEKMRTLALSPPARALLDDARPYADAGTESILYARLRWLGLPMRRQATILGHRVDLLIGDRLVIQIDGGHHVGEQRASDNAHDTELILAGYYPIRVTYWQLMHDWHAVESRILEAVARGLHRA